MKKFPTANPPAHPVPSGAGGGSRRKPHHFLAFLLLVWAAAAAPGAQERVFFAPSATDPEITQFDNSHYAVVDPDVPARELLVVFLPGSGGVPFFYTDFIENAASLGFHGLGLMYPNATPINQLVAVNDPLNPEAALLARLEVIDGADRVSYLEVNRTNCIENRLLKALQYLDATRPSMGWDSYFAGDTILWSKLILCGHSQGGGHAGVMAKTRTVHRCLFFGSMDYWAAGDRPYDWMSLPPLTPISQWFLLAHERDQLLDFGRMQTAASALDVDRYGAFLRAESASDADFRGRHFLSTNLEPARGAAGSYHSTMISDADTPREADGITPVLKPAWDYFLLHATPPVALELTAASLEIYFCPGTLEFSETLADWEAVPGAGSPLSIPRDVLGERGFYRLRLAP
jgi:hypothetical protein